MPILSCLDYYLPILQGLHTHPDGLTGPQLTELVARVTGLTPDEREETVADRAPTYVLRIRQARYRLKSRDLVDEHPDDRWVITETGQRTLAGDLPLLANRPPPVRPTEALPLKDSASQRYGALPTAVVAPPVPAGVPIGQDDPVDAPLERLERAVKEIEEQIESDLLERLCQVTPRFFERTVLRLLEVMGYGKPRRADGPGDRGIICTDRLELEQVYFQIKPRKRGGRIEPEDIVAFCDVMPPQHLLKGVFITSGSFTKPAQERAERGPEKVALIDGRKLVALMRELGVGVSIARVRVIPELDRSFFDGGG